MNYFKLNNQKIPSIGIGTWRLDDNTCTNSVKIALDKGYRHIDTADIYGNHTAVGKALKETNVDREDIFLTSKVWHTSLDYTSVISSCERNLLELNVDYINLYLIHWPNKNIPLKETISALLELQSRGLIKDWGVSNFTKHHIQDCLDLGYKPANNQIEFHPSFYQKELKEFCDNNNILITAYSPLGQGLDLEIQLLKDLSNKYSKTVPQIILKWIISKNIVAIPKATDESLIVENISIFDFELSQEDIVKIDNLNINKRLLRQSFDEFDY